MRKSKKDQGTESNRQEAAEPAKKSTFAYGLALLSACVVFALITLGAFGGAGAVVTDFLLLSVPTNCAILMYGGILTRRCR